MALRRSPNFVAACAPTCASKNAGEAPPRMDEVVVVDEGNWLTLTK
jgi:hypothetical protein